MLSYLPDLPDFITGILFISGIHCNTGDAHVNACDVLRFNDRFFMNLNSNHEAEQFVFPDEITLPSYPFQGYLTIFYNGHGYPDSSTCGVDTYLIHTFEVQYSLIIYNRTVIPELEEMISISLIRFNNLPYDSDGYLCCMIECFP